jgi:hypothetical protein
MWFRQVLPAGTFHADMHWFQQLQNREVMSMIDPKGTQPELLAKLAKSARNNSGKPDKSGLEADRETAAIPTDPALKQDAATKVLREGVTHRDQGAEEAIDKLPDRVAKK